ncbi:MAG: dihydrodipicolinate synthase family protein, partial [Variovorax sp.]
MTDFRGTYTIMVTPFDAEGAVDVPALERYVDWQIESGIHGLIPLGSTGEFLSMTDDEIELVAKTVIDRTAGRVPVLIGTTAEDTRVAARKSRMAESLGADGVMVLPPFYCTPTDDELYQHYKSISDAIGIPIMVYNNPAVTNVDLKPKLVARLSQLDNCRYIKESTLEVTRVRDIMRLSDGRMKVFGGIMGFESYVEGAVGWAAVPSNGAPAEMARLYDLVMAGELAQARDLSFKYFPMIDFVAGQQYVAGTKAMLAA